MKKQTDRGLPRLANKLIYLSGERFQSYLGLYVQAVKMACKVLNVPTHTGSAKTFIRNNREALQAYVDANAKQLSAIKKTRKTSRQPRKPKKHVSDSAAFLSSYEWRKLRMQALIKYGPKCMCCGATPETGAVMNVDHIKPRKLYPDLAWDINNLQVLCNVCNHGKGNWDQTDWRGK